MEKGLVRSEILNKLNLSVHGKLTEYNAVIGQACKEDAEFMAHLIAYDFVNGQIKDTKIALPVITLASKEFPDELVENSVAHLAMQPPRELVKALKFSIDSGAPARRQKLLEKTIRRYLAVKESEPGKWNRLAVRHRRSLRDLYARTHAPMAPWASALLFKNQDKENRKPISAQYLPGSIFADIANLKLMDSAQVAAAIQKWHLSPLVVSGALAGAKAKQDDAKVVQATMDQMSDTEVVSRAKSLEKRGVGKDAVLKDAFRKKVSKATKSKKATLKTSVAADEVEDESMKTMLRELQERQIQAQKESGRGIDGNWLVICDRSASQQTAIALGTHIAAAIAKFVTGQVWLVFCNSDVTPMEATGKTLEELQARTKLVIAAGNTSYGVGLAWAIEKGLQLDGVAIVGDGGENTQHYAQAHIAYEKRFGKVLPTYLYRTFCPPGQPDPRMFGQIMGSVGRQFTEFDLTSGAVDYYSIPNIVQSMNASRFGVVEKIMACPLVTLDQVLPALVQHA